MLHVGLTGNVAAGKSTVAALFARWGATLIDADAIVRDLQRPGTPVFDAIVARFGPGIVARSGVLDRAALRRLVLADPAARAALNAIVHPAVAARRADLLAKAQADGVRLVVDDIPLLFEVMDPSAFDAVVLVDAPADVRRRRLEALRGLSAAEAEQFLEMQMPSAEKRARSTYVIDNDGDLEHLEARARDVFDALQVRADA